MSTSVTTGIGGSFSPDPALPAETILTFYERLGLRPDRLSLTRWDRSRPFRAETLRAAVLEPAHQELHVLADSVPEMTSYLRSDDPRNEEYVNRWVAIVLSRIPAAITAPIRALMEELTRLYPIRHGSAGGYRSAAHAAQECCHSGAYSPLELDPDTRARLKEDAMLRQEVRVRLRRLYPITIVGPELWAQLPPLPEGAAVTVEDLGNCKMLRCWPELVEPHDPQFLLGTRALRRWLWPYTIQNPADDPDVIDQMLAGRNLL